MCLPLKNLTNKYLGCLGFIVKAALILNSFSCYMSAKKYYLAIVVANQQTSKYNNVNKSADHRNLQLPPAQNSSDSDN